MLKKIIFLTGSPLKLANIQHLGRYLALKFEDFHEVTYNANYTEPRIHNRKELLKESVNSAIEQIKKAGKSFKKVLFLIEDTSVRIDALSSSKKEVPGLDVKYWMQTISFEKLDKVLKKANNNRSVTVRSDMILFSADGKINKHFIGISKGSIVEKEYEIKTQLLYPWLDNKTFNKWFVPDGYSKPISMLPIEQADKADFRQKAFTKLVNYLNEERLLGKIPKRELEFWTARTLLIIVGYSCAGKTTIAQYIDKKYNFIHIEASDLMKLNFYKLHGVINSYKLEDFASDVLQDKPETVPKRIIDELDAFQHKANIVITGFRSPKEAEYLMSKLNDIYSIHVFKIQTNIEKRLTRAQSRKRNGDISSMAKLEKKDSIQRKMGLDEFCGEPLDNNSTFESLYKQFDSWIDSTLQINDNSNNFIPKVGNLKKEVMKFLLKHYDANGKGNYFTTTDISKKIEHHKDNISRFFNQRHSADFEINAIDGVMKYRLSNTGYSKAIRLID